MDNHPDPEADLSRPNRNRPDRGMARTPIRNRRTLPASSVYATSDQRDGSMKHRARKRRRPANWVPLVPLAVAVLEVVRAIIERHQ
jgi:hypothetical protein